MKISDAIFAGKGKETALNTHRMHGAVSHNTILSADEQLFIYGSYSLFFCSFTDKILNG